MSDAAARLLFCDIDGESVGLEEVIFDGLERDYSERYPALRELLAVGTPVQQLNACVVLASWGLRDGLLTTAEWARTPGDVPWAEEPVSVDRLFGVDDAFARLAYALHVASNFDLTPVGARLRISATRALLSAHHCVFFDRSMLVLLELDTQLAEATCHELDAAVGRTVEAASAPQSFDMATQAALLVGPLATLDDRRAASLANDVAWLARDQPRALRELACALGSGTGAGTLQWLEDLSNSSHAEVAREARAWLRRRGVTAAAPRSNPATQRADGGFRG